MPIQPIPGGITPDPQANLGALALMNNVNNYAEANVAVTTSGTSVTLTATQALCGSLILNAGASGAFTINLPSTAALVASLGPTVFVGYAEPVQITNNNIGQTGTLTAGDANTTLIGNVTIATNTTRKFIMTVTALGATPAVTFQNIGTWNL